MNLFQRLRDALGLDEPYDDYDDDYGESEAEQPAYATGGEAAASRRPPSDRSTSKNVIGLPGLAMEMVLMQPYSFDEIPQAVTALRERKSVILDLSLMDVEQAQRSADYVAGGAFAIDGHQRQLGPSVFLFTPNFVQISHYESIDASGFKPRPQENTAPDFS